MNIDYQSTSESESLLTVQAGALDVTIIPAVNSPDWVVPSSLILDVKQLDSQSNNFSWHGNVLPIYSLASDDDGTKNLVVISGFTNNETDAYTMPIGLLIEEPTERRQLKLADISDAEGYNIKYNYPHVFQAVLIDSSVYVVPDIASLTKSLRENEA